MIKNFDVLLDKYARLIVEVGANIQKEEPVQIICPIEASDFAHMLAKYAYARGAKTVVIEYEDETLKKMKFEKESIETLQEFPKWLVDKAIYRGESGYAKTDGLRLRPVSRDDLSAGSCTTGHKVLRVVRRASDQHCKFKDLSNPTRDPLWSGADSAESWP